MNLMDMVAYSHILAYNCDFAGTPLLLRARDGTAPQHGSSGNRSMRSAARRFFEHCEINHKYGLSRFALPRAEMPSAREIL
jgi:hypothetical protein